MASARSEINRFAFFTTASLSLGGKSDPDKIVVRNKKEMDEQLFKLYNLIADIENYRDAILTLPQTDPDIQKVTDDKKQIFNDLMSELNEELRALFHGKHPYENYNIMTLEYLFRSLKTILDQYDTPQNRAILNCPRNENINITQAALGVTALMVATTLGFTLPAVFLGAYGLSYLGKTATRKGYLHNNAVKDVEYFDTNIDAYSNQLFKSLKDEITAKYSYLSVHIAEQNKFPSIDQIHQASKRRTP